MIVKVSEKREAFLLLCIFGRFLRGYDIEYVDICVLSSTDSFGSRRLMSILAEKWKSEAFYLYFYKKSLIRLYCILAVSMINNILEEVKNLWQEIRRLCSYLQDLKKASSEEMRRSVYANYAAFIRCGHECLNHLNEILYWWQLPINCLELF